MTWNEFVAKVEEQLKERNIPPTALIQYIDWSSDMIGIGLGDIHVNWFPEANQIAIGED